MLRHCCLQLTDSPKTPRCLWVKDRVHKPKPDGQGKNENGQLQGALTFHQNQRQCQGYRQVFTSSHPTCSVSGAVSGSVRANQSPVGSVPSVIPVARSGLSLLCREAMDSNPQDLSVLHLFSMLKSGEPFPVLPGTASGVDHIPGPRARSCRCP